MKLLMRVEQLLEVGLELELLVAMTFAVPQIVMSLEVQLEPRIPLEQEQEQELELELKLELLMLLEVKLEVPVL
jgi:hypothetical protein